MRTFRSLLILIPLVLTLGCSAKQENSTEDSKPEGVLADAHKNALEKSHQVSDVLQEANTKQMQEVDKQTGKTED